MRKTQNREDIINIFKKNPGKFFSAKEIYEKLQDLDLATVYRNLSLFKNEGLIKEHKINTEKESFYEFSSNNSHHHVVCEACSEVIHVDLPKSVLKNIKGIGHFKKWQYFRDYFWCL